MVPRRQSETAITTREKPFIMCRQRLRCAREFSLSGGIGIIRVSVGATIKGRDDDLGVLFRISSIEE